MLALYQLPAKHDPILSPPSRSLKFSKITTVRALQASGPLPLLTPRSQLLLLPFRISTAAQFIFAVLLVGGRRAQNLVLRIRGCSAAVPAHRCAATCSGCRAFFSGMLLFLRLVFKFWFCSDPCTLYVCSEPTSRAASSLCMTAFPFYSLPSVSVQTKTPSLQYLYDAVYVSTCIRVASALKPVADIMFQDGSAGR